MNPKPRRALLDGASPGHGSLTSQQVADAVDAATLVAAARARVFFGHQSVGGNLVEGIARAYAAHQLPAPEIIEVSPGSRTVLPSGGVVAHAAIGHNGDPSSKLDQFDSMLRSGLGEQVGVALMKFCYVDLTAETDVGPLFASYRETLAALARDYPEVVFLHVTTPLTTPGHGLKDRLRPLLRRGHQVSAANATRERLNALLRSSYDVRLFDLAALESSAPDGTRIETSHRGHAAFGLYEGYAVDEGHLTPDFAQLAASRLLTLVAERTS